MNWVILIAIIIISIVIIINFFNQKKVVNLFKKGGVIVSGYKGAGKDLLFCFVINKRKENYISNVQYSNPKKKYKRFDFNIKVWELAGNTYEDLTENKVKRYTYPYPDGIDYYISDMGIYFPAQYHKELEKKYKSSPMFVALSRQLGETNVHGNSQAQGRVWDKIREQTPNYAVAWWSKVFFNKFFIQKLSIYDKQESAENKIKKPYFGIGKKAREARINFEIQHGKIKNIIYGGKLKYKYDSRRFKRILENEVKDYENDEEV